MDTLSFLWPQGFVFAIPPFALVSRVLARIRRERAEILVLTTKVPSSSLSILCSPVAVFTVFILSQVSSSIPQLSQAAVVGSLEIERERIVSLGCCSEVTISIQNCQKVSTL